AYCVFLSSFPTRRSSDLLGVDFAAVCSLAHVARSFDPALGIVEPCEFGGLCHEENFALPCACGWIGHVACSFAAHYEHVAFLSCVESLSFPFVGPVGFEEDTDGVECSTVDLSSGLAFIVHFNADAVWCDLFDCA